MKKVLFSLLAFCLLVLPSAVQALTANDVGITGPNSLTSNNGNNSLKLSSENPINSVASIINIVISLLGLGAVVIILIGGFRWMTSMGNDDSIKKAKKMITAGVVGLVIILAAWGIARFVVIRVSNSIAGI